ncbi:MAG: type II toxin-antitoxin system VapC family toxin [Proteobacteria bacterium]|nr:type II toxin-antitoxin system VapC family toxin [Pseudomonadota bacterium]MYJ94398.1 type II toxin-antitoxin system VapC family toxin [Pseudomonadota bacterium]
MMAPVAWILDTNVVSEMMRPYPEPRVAWFLDAIAHEGIGISTVTIWEILNGIGRLTTEQRREELAMRFRSILEDVFEDRVLDWTASDALECAVILIIKRRMGESLDHRLPDGMLAGAASSRNLTIVTGNEKEFRNTGVKAINPWTAAAPGIALRA